MTAHKIALIGNQARSALNFRGSLISRLVKENCKVFLLVPDFDESTRASTHSLGAIPVDYPLQRTGMNPLHDIRSLLVLHRLLRELKVDSVLSYFIKPVIYGTLAARFAGIRRRLALIEGAGFVYADVGMKSRRRQFVRFVVTMLYKTALRGRCQVIVLNQDDRDLFVRLGIAKPKQVTVLPGIGIDLEHYHKAPCVQDPPTFCLAARLIKEKGIHTFVEAARTVKNHYPRARFLLLGDLDANPGSLTAQQIHDWIDTGIVEWPGHVDDIRPYLAQSSVLVLPSYYREGLPRSILEAMSMGRAVITTDNPGCREAINDGVEGYIVPIKDSKALAQAMIHFIEQPSRIETMGLAARRRAETKYDVKKINQYFIDSLAC